MPLDHRLVVFDWDGTLVDSAALIVDSIQRSCRDIGLPVPDDAACRGIIGLGLAEAIAALLPGLPALEHPRLVERYRHHYLGRDRDTLAFAGAGELLAALAASGRFIAVATGKGRPGLERSLDHTGFRPYVDASRCADECHSKPHPQMLLELMNHFGVEPGDTLMIGDTVHDLNMAANAGVAAVALTHGAGARDALCALDPLCCLDDLPTLGRLLLGDDGTLP